MKVFVVGIGGGVGSRLARLLVAGGDEVGGLYRRPEQRKLLEGDGVIATYGDLTHLNDAALADLLTGTDVLVFSAGAGGEGGAAATTAVDGEGLSTTIAAARLAGVRRVLLVSVFPEAWRNREVSNTFEHYIEVKKRADVELAATELDWVILRPAALSNEPGTGHVSLAPALIHTHITRDDVAATLAQLVHTPQLRRQILELTEGPTPVAAAVQQQAGDT